MVCVKTWPDLLINRADSQYSCYALLGGVSIYHHAEFQEENGLLIPFLIT